MVRRHDDIQSACMKILLALIFLDKQMSLSLLKTKFAFPAFVAVGAILALIVVSIAPDIEHEDKGAPAPVAEYIEAKLRPFVPRAKGYGFVVPSTLLEASAEVPGRIIYLNPDVKAGAFLQAGTEVLRIDPTDYQLALAEARANLAVARAQKNEQLLLLESAKTAHEIAVRNLTLGEKNLERRRNLLKKGTISQASLDQEEQRVLQLRQDQQARQQQLDTLPSQLEVAAARIKQNEARLVEQEERLARTSISLPFTTRIAAVHVDEGEYVSLGGRLFDAHSVDSVEISTRMSIGSLQTLLAGMPGLSRDSIRTPGELINTLRFKAEVVLPNPLYDARWKGNVVRIGESQDMETRTIAIVVRVEDPYGQIVPGKRPPLLKGMYVAVNLESDLIESLVVPRHAIHDGRIYVAAPDGKLLLRVVKVVYQGDVAVVINGLSIGERVIVTDLMPAVDGMAIDARFSEVADAALNAVSVAGTTEVAK